jgi:hypothetical protein
MVEPDGRVKPDPVLYVDAEPIFATLMQLFAHQTFDMEHLVPWLESIVEQTPET